MLWRLFKTAIFSIVAPGTVGVLGPQWVKNGGIELPFVVRVLGVALFLIGVAIYLGETGAVNLYGPAYGLPRAISGMNSSWFRGYGDPPPQTVIVLGEHRDFVDQNFSSCELADHLTNRYGIANMSITGCDDDVFVCRNLRQPWPEFWEHFRYYG